MVRERTAEIVPRLGAAVFWLPESCPVPMEDPLQCSASIASKYLASMILGSRLYLGWNQRDSISACLQLRNTLYVPRLSAEFIHSYAHNRFSQLKGRGSGGKQIQPFLQ